MSLGVKRYRVRLDADDGVGLERALGHRLEPEGMWIRLAAPPEVDTPAEVIILFSDGRVALTGAGWVSHHQGEETHLELEWADAGETGLARRLFTPPGRAVTLDELESPDEVPLVPSTAPEASGRRLHPDLVWDFAAASPELPDLVVEELEDGEPAAGSGEPAADPVAEDGDELRPAPASDPEAWTEAEDTATDGLAAAGPPSPTADEPPGSPAPTREAARCAVRGAAIDLGSAVTHLAAVDLAGGPPRLLGSDGGIDPMPTVVAIRPDGRVEVGHEAVGSRERHPERVVTEIKRLLGRSVDTPIGRALREHLPWAHDLEPDGAVLSLVDGTPRSMEELAAQLLAAVARPLDPSGPGPLTLVVPTWWGVRARAAGRRAAAKAGLSDVELTSSCLAAALHVWPRGTPELRRVLVLDFGAGTLDAAVVQISGGSFGVLAGSGDPFLGGVEFDAAVAQALFQKLTDGGERPQTTVGEVLGTAEGGKWAFDDVSRVHLALARGGAEIEVARRDVEALWATLIERAVVVAKDVVGQAGLGMQDVDEVLLTGGQSRSPFVEQRIRAAFGRSCRLADQPGVAALGAAYGMARRRDGIELSETTTYGILVGPPRGPLGLAIPPGTAFPARGEVVVELAPDEEEVLVFEGGPGGSDELQPLGRIRIGGLAPRRRSTCGIRLRIDCEGSGELRTEGAELESGETLLTQLVTGLRSVDASPGSTPPSPEDPTVPPQAGGFLDWVRRKLRG